MARRGILCEVTTPGRGLPERFLVEGDRFLIGRAAGCDLRLQEGDVSNRHAVIQRHRSGLVALSDAGSTSGVYLGAEGRRQLRAPEPLAVGKVFRLGDHLLKILDLAYTDAGDELAPPVVRDLHFECAQLVCRGRVVLASRTGTSALHRELATLLLGGPGVLDGDAIRCTEPVELVHELARLMAALAEPIAGITLRANLRDIVIGTTALELLHDDAEPARAAWRWLARHASLPRLSAGVLRGMLLGGAFRPTLPEELERDAGEPPGLGLWLDIFQHGYLLHVERDVSIGSFDSGSEIEVEGSRIRPVALRLAGGHWVADVNEQRGLPLEVGSRLDLGSARLVVTSIR